MATNDMRLLQIAHFADMIKWSAHGSAFGTVKSKFPLVPLSVVLRRIKDPITIEDGVLYKRITIRNNGRGVVQRDELLGSEIGTKRQFVAHAGQFIISRIDARNGAFGIVPKHLEGAVVTNDFWLFEVQKALPEYLMLVLSSKRFQQYWQTQSSGTTNRQRVSESDFLQSRISLSNIDIQKKLIEVYANKTRVACSFDAQAQKILADLNDYLFEELGIKEQCKNADMQLINYTSFSRLCQWGVDKHNIAFPYMFTKYNPFSFANKPTWVNALLRGKSPRYSSNATCIVLNQKCNRVDSIDLKFAKKVTADWLDQIDKDHLTKENDILINSTGEGTIGRASLVRKEFAGLAYDSHLLLLRVNATELDAQLVVDLLNSPFGRRQVELYKSAQATKQTELGIENAKRFLFPMPDISEQKRISAQVNEMKKEATRLRNGAKSLRQEANNEFEASVFRAEY